MDILTLFAPDTMVFKLIMALSLGLFIGLRREIDIQKEGSESFVGFRTMPLIVLIGAISTLIPSIPFLPIVCLIGLLIFLSIAYYNGVFKLHLIGLTSEFATVLMFLAGVFVGLGEFIVAILITVVIGTLTGFKTELHSFARGVSVKEWRGALQLLILSAVVLPFLPRTALDPWGVLIPFDIWLLVIFISAIGFFGYFFNKYFGSKKSILATTVLGSLVSSTAVAIALGIQAKQNKEVHKQVFILALLVAIATMLARTILAIGAIATGEVRSVVIIPIVMLLTTILAIGFAWLNNKEKLESSVEISPDLESPFQLLPALKFAALFVVILVGVALSQNYIGGLGVLFVAAVSALADVDASILSALQTYKGNEISLVIAQAAIMISIVVNTVVKFGYILILSRKDIAKSFGWYVGIISLSGVLAYLVLL